MYKLIVLLGFLEFVWTNVVTEGNHPNVIIMHSRNLLWDDLSMHVNSKDSENLTPNIDYLAYSGVILNRFYANGGLESLLTGCYQRSKYSKPNLMTLYFERNGYSVNFITRNSYDKIETFEKGVLDTITNESQPFVTVVDFGVVGEDVKMPFIDEIVASVVTKAHKVGVMNNTILLFLSLPDSNDSPLEINIRRTAFIYSPLLKLKQRVSNQVIHVIDLLPTLVNATDLKWRTRDKIYVDGINQWQALNANDDERLDVYGDNFYISNFWKLSYGNGNDTESYGSLDNENMESDKDMSEYDFDAYAKNLLVSEVHLVLTSQLTSQQVRLAKSRARVHCNLKDVDEQIVKNIKCSRSSPCLFNLLEDPCEFDNMHETEFDLRRKHMKKVFEQYLNDGIIEAHSDPIYEVEDTVATMEDGTIVGIILGGTIAACIVTFIIVVCVKERCNQRRSVYHNKSETNIAAKDGPSKETFEGNDISIITKM